MSKNETLHIRVNGHVKQRAERTLDMLGLSLSEAVNMLLHQISLVGGLPFEVKVPPAPANVIAPDREALYHMLAVGEDQIKAGNVVAANDVMTKLIDKEK